MRSKLDSRNVRIKPATPRDSAGFPFDRKVMASGLAFLLKSPSTGGAWPLLKCGQPVGYLILTFEFDLEFGGRQALLNDLYIAPPHRKMGIGTIVLAQIEDFCRSSGVRAIELHVTIKNASVVRF